MKLKKYMRIIKTKEQVERKRKNREEANKGCDVCPCCGHKDIIPTLPVHIKIFSLFGIYHIDEYSCIKCGACWQSEKYR